MKICDQCGGLIGEPGERIAGTPCKCLLASAPGSVVAHCVFCKEPLTRPGGKKWWIAGTHYDEGLCYDCIMAGMRVLMAGIDYAQEHGEGTNENPPNAPHERRAGNAQ